MDHDQQTTMAQLPISSKGRFVQWNITWTVLYYELTVMLIVIANNIIIIIILPEIIIYIYFILSDFSDANVYV